MATPGSNPRARRVPIAARPLRAPRHDQAHPVEPVEEIAAQAFDTRHVAVYHHAVGPALQVLGVVPALEFERLGFLGLLAMRRGWVGIAAVGARQAVDHQLECAGGLVPVGRRERMTPWAATQRS